MNSHCVSLWFGNDEGAFERRLHSRCGPPWLVCSGENVFASHNQKLERKLGSHLGGCRLTSSTSPLFRREPEFDYRDD